MSISNEETAATCGLYPGRRMLGESHLAPVTEVMKQGIIGLTKAMAAELAPRGIRVSAVCPRPIVTPMMESELALFPDPEAVRIEAINRVPLNRWATAEEVAEAILFLASATSATGACLALDGGTTAI